ncbi:MAG: hypothetical protein ABI693_16240 [Bryobacteraceae bacterium]
MGSFVGKEAEFFAAMDGFGPLTTTNSPFAFGYGDLAFGCAVGEKSFVLGGILTWQNYVPADEEAIRDVITGYLGLPLIGPGAGGFFRVSLV